MSADWKRDHFRNFKCVYSFWLEEEWAALVPPHFFINSKKFPNVSGCWIQPGEFIILHVCFLIINCKWRFMFSSQFLKLFRRNVGNREDGSGIYEKSKVGFRSNFSLYLGMKSRASQFRAPVWTSGPNQPLLHAHETRHSFGSASLKEPKSPNQKGLHHRKAVAVFQHRLVMQLSAGDAL